MDTKTEFFQYPSLGFDDFVFDASVFFVQDERLDSRNINNEYKISKVVLNLTAKQSVMSKRRY